MVNDKVNVAVLGATGAVGREFLRIFAARSFPVGNLRLFASARSAGQTVDYLGNSISIEDAATADWAGVDYAFFSAGAGRSREYAPIANAAGCTVIDNSSAFRMDDQVPLIVPEVNGDRLPSDAKLVANPNCTAAILCTAIAPIERRARIARLVVSTYQSASGGGAAVMEELRAQTEATLAGREIMPEVLPHPYAFNLFSHNTPIGEDGFNEEESKVIAETRRMMGRPDLAINVTCVRVPVMRAHSESITIEFEGAAPSEEDIRQWLNEAPGVRVVDDRANNHFPMPSEASGTDDVLVGRIRRDPSHPNAVLLFVSGDQLLKGAALNAVQIAETLIRLRS
ncbi:MAG: aspartate-semialdehyde dehydrogenase [Fimbriimonadaceae bacterium]|nr:aspartate-semialdehyde dehydrogenase [Fimbriimonadaceae bacterium]